MADFFQTGAIATLHRLGEPGTERLESELVEFTRQKPVALVLPCHARELGSEALNGIIHELKSVPYLSEIVVGIDHASPEEWREARKVFGALPQQPTLLWLHGPRFQSLYRILEDAELTVGAPGKGRNVWTSFGYVLANNQSQSVVVHDCDILTYNREMLARLCYPLAHPAMGYDFCKGYYPRVTDRLNGRVMRLLMTPLLRSLKSILGQHPFLVYMDTFRYPLAGEFGMKIDLVRRTRIPADWGLEVGLLADIFRNAAPKSICQVDLANNYDHKHQELSARNADRGLSKMAVDIGKTIFRLMASEGIKLDSGLFDTLLTAYVRHAEDAIRFYGADAAINGLKFDRHAEEVAAATFARSIRAASRAFLEDPLGSPMIPNWSRIKSAFPKFLSQLHEAVQLDMRDH